MSFNPAQRQKLAILLKLKQQQGTLPPRPNMGMQVKPFSPAPLAPNLAPAPSMSVPNVSAPRPMSLPKPVMPQSFGSPFGNIKKKLKF